MGRLVGREGELRLLEWFMEDPVCRGCAVIGDPGVGKTALLRRFAEGRRAVHLVLGPGSEREIVENMTEQMRGCVHCDGTADSLLDFFDLLTGVCEEAPTLVILDGYPHLSGSVAYADTRLQGFMDETAGRTGAKVVVCGPPTGRMAGIVSGVGSPLYNRFRHLVHVPPLPFPDTCGLHPDMDDRDQMMMHMVFGGMPRDHIRYRMPTFGEMVARHFLAPGLPLRDEARSRIPCGPAERYEPVVRAVARGAGSVGDMADDTGMPPDICSEVVSELEGAGVLERLHPMYGAPEDPRYVIPDGLTDLWYSVFDGLDGREPPDDPEGRYAPIRKGLQSFMSRRFVRFCAEFMRRSYSCREIGSWWGSEEVDDDVYTDVGIDIVAHITEGGKRAAMFCDCRFGGSPTGESDLRALVRRTERLTPVGNPVLFSAAGFDDDVRCSAVLEGAVLIGTDELMGREKAPRLLAPVGRDRG